MIKNTRMITAFVKIFIIWVFVYSVINCDNNDIQNEALVSCYEYINRELRSFSKYEYDSKGNNIKTYKYYYNEGKLDSYAEYEYFFIDDVIKKSIYFRDGILTSNYEYVNDPNGNIVKINYYYINEDLDIHSEYEYTKNILEKSSFFENKKLSSYSKYEYDLKENIIKICNYDASGDMKDCWQNEHEYDSIGNIIKSKSFLNGLYQSFFEYEYDSRRNITKEKMHYQMKDGEFLVEKIFVNVYQKI